MLSLEFSLVDGPAVRPDICPLFTAWAIIRLMFIFLSPWGRSHFGIVLSLVMAAFRLQGLWHHFDWTLAKGILEGVGLQKKAVVGHAVPSRSALDHCRKVLIAPRKTAEAC